MCQLYPGVFIARSLKNELLCANTCLCFFEVDYCKALHSVIPLNLLEASVYLDSNSNGMMDACPWDLVTSHSQQQQWLPACSWSQFKILLVTFTAISGLNSGCLKDHLSLYYDAHFLRSEEAALLCLPTKLEAELRNWLPPFSFSANYKSSSAQNFMEALIQKVAFLCCRWKCI